MWKPGGIMLKPILTLLLSGLLMGQSNFATLSIYKDGSALVKQPVIWNVSRGEDYLIYDDLPKSIEKESPFLHIEGVQVLSQQYYNKVFNSIDYYDALIGEKVTLKPKNNKAISGILLEYSHQALTIEFKNTILTYPQIEVEFIQVKGKIKNPVFRPYLSWSVEAEASGDIEAEILYKTSHMHWNTLYRLLLHDQDQGELIVDAVISNDTDLDYEDAKLQVIEGKLNRVHGKKNYGGPARTERMMLSPNVPAATESELGDYHIYTLNGAHDFRSKEKISVRLYGPLKVQFQKSYLFENTERRQKEEPLSIQLSMENTEAFGLGLPLPEGKVEMYLNTETHAMEYVGSDRIGQTPKDQKIELSSGRAFEVTGKRKVLNYDRQRKSEEAVIEIEIINGRQEAINVKLIEHIHGDWIVKEESDKYTKEDASTIHFTLTLDAGKTKLVSYTYRKQWQ